MTRTTFLHVGPPKTGTTFLQAGWRQQKQRLADQGLLYPGTESADQFRACMVALEHKVYTPRMSEQRAGLWEEFLTQIEQHSGNALLSSEFYARADPETAERIIAQLKEVSEQVHVVITARDLGRQVLASWQQYVKRSGTRTLQSFWDRHHAGGESRWKFWRNQDLAALAQRWLDAGADAVTLVVVGTPGTARDQIWHDLSSILGVPAAPLPTPSRSNSSLGGVEIEVLRRMNARLPKDRDMIRTAHLTSKRYSDQLAALKLPKVQVAISQTLVDEVNVRSRDQLERLEALVTAGTLTTIGDLAGLTPQIAAAPAKVDDAQVAEACVRFLAATVEDDLRARAREDALRAQVRDLRAELRIGPSLRRVARRLTRQGD